MMRRNPDPEKPPTRTAFQEALRYIARRGRSVAEVRQRLADRGHEAEAIDEAEQRLFAEKLLDDGALAEHYLSARSERLGHGPDRMVRELMRRGVPEAVVRSAWASLMDRGEVDPEAVLARRVDDAVRRESGIADPRTYKRIYSRLLRAGFAPASIHRELRAHVSTEGFQAQNLEPPGMDDDAIR